MTAHGIMFHHFHDTDRHVPGQGSISSQDLERMLAWYSRKFSLLSADIWLERALAGTLKEDEVCLTFDDGLLCQYDIALPVLEKRGLRAFWFVYTAPIAGELVKLEVYRYFRSKEFRDVNDFYRAFDTALERSAWAGQVSSALKDFSAAEVIRQFPFYSVVDVRFRYIRDRVLEGAAFEGIMDELMKARGMDAGQVKDLLWMGQEHVSDLHSRGHLIGLHSHHHPTLLCGLPVAEQRKEYEENKREIENIIGTPVRVMSHPCNSYGKETLDLLRDLGIQLGFRANMAQAEYSVLEYPRIDHAVVMKEMSR
jgi:peptidoglycan/xylan/chitin deacetylase (PgdA/CDA1 family)